MRALIASAALAALALGCAPRPRPPEVPDVSQGEWSLSRERLAEVRKEQPERPYVERVKIAIHDPRTNKAYEGRGAVAVSPERAARLIMIGPGGTTALDVWVTPERFRFVVPAIHFERRGGTDPEETRGLPIGMLRWWFLSPLSGRLLMARSSKAESAFLLREGTATVLVRTDGAHFLAVRRQGENVEGIEWLGAGLAPAAGARGRYMEGKLGLQVDVLVEEVMEREPDPAAFLDPDKGDTSL